MYDASVCVLERACVSACGVYHWDKCANQSQKDVSKRCCHVTEGMDGAMISALWLSVETHTSLLLSSANGSLLLLTLF